MSAPAGRDRAELSGPIGWLFRALSVAAGVMVAIMMVVTTVDVVGRYFFSRPLFAAFEITEILMALLIFAGLPLATMARENIVVSILSDNFPEGLREIQIRVFEAICGLVCLAMAWRVWLYGERLWRTRDRTLELQIPLGLLAQVIAVLVLLTGLAFLISALRRRSGGTPAATDHIA